MPDFFQEQAAADAHPDGLDVLGNPTARTALTVIGFNKVAHTFGLEKGKPVRALDGVTFEVKRHEFVAVLGPSGCGKSTLARMVSGLVQPTSGSVEIYGSRVTEPRDEVGMVFQRPVLLPWCNVVENVTFPLRHKYGHVSAEDRSRAAHLLELVGLKDFVRSEVKALSGGMQQRVAIARALLLDPEILLMDEPFSALDALTRDEMSLELVRIFQERPKTVMFITHSIAEAVLLSHRIVIMNARPGSIREIIDVPLPHPRSLETMSSPAFHELSHSIRTRLFSKSAA